MTGTRAAVAAGLLVVALLLASSFDTPATHAASTPIPQVLTPAADAYVSEAVPDGNYGDRPHLRVDGSAIAHGYLRFDVPTVAGPITRATLRVYATSPSAEGFDAHGVADDTWDEGTLTYGTAPPRGTSVGSSGPFAEATWVGVDVTSLATGTGPVSIALSGTSVTAIALASRETGANAPQLVLEIGPTPTATVTLTATASRTSTPTPTHTSTPTRTATPSAPAGYQPSAPIAAAFFYPWFPQAWTQSDVFPYTNYTPSLGYYDLTDDATIDRQLRMVKEAHLDALISSWWGQRDHTDLKLLHLLERTERAGSPYPDLRWAIYYENESQGDPTVAQIVADLRYLQGTSFAHPSYLRVDGKPVVFVYPDDNDRHGMNSRWAQAKAELAGDVHVVLKVYVGYTIAPDQPDSWHQYGPAAASSIHLPYSATVSPGFWQKNLSVRLARDPVLFEANVKAMVASGAFWQLITTWNEWGEGTAVEPSEQWGTTYVDILCRNLPGSTPCATTTPTPTPTPVLPNFSHVYWVVMQNREYGEVIGNTSAPYINSLAAQYGSATQSFAVAHPSQPNFFALFSGATQFLDDNLHDLAGQNLADQLEARGKSWRVWAENVPPGCYAGATASGGTDGAGTYVRHHEPAISFTNIRTDPVRCARIAGLSAFDPAAAQFHLIVPNLCHSMRDCGIRSGDDFLKSFVPRILSSPAWQQGGVLFVTWDEGSSNVNGGGRVLTLVISPQVAAGTRSGIPHNHYSLLRTVQDAWGLGCSNSSCGANAYREFFR